MVTELLLGQSPVCTIMSAEMDQPAWPKAEDETAREERDGSIWSVEQRELEKVRVVYGGRYKSIFREHRTDTPAGHQ